MTSKDGWIREGNEDQTKEENSARRSSNLGAIPGLVIVKSQQPKASIRRKRASTKMTTTNCQTEDNNVPGRKNRSLLKSLGIFCFLGIIAFAINKETWTSSLWNNRDPSSATSASQNHHTYPRRQLLETSSTVVKVYYDAASESSNLFRKFQQELSAAGSLVEGAPLDVNAPVTCPGGASERIQELIELEQPHLALEILKYCGIAYGGGSGLFLDAGSSVLVDTLTQLLEGYHGKNVAVLNDSFLSSSIHGGLLFFHPNHATANIAIAKQMLEILLTTKVQNLLSNPTLLPKSLYDLLAVEANLSQLVAGSSDKWYFLQHSCIIEPLGGRQATAPISTYALQSYR